MLSDKIGYLPRMDYCHFFKTEVEIHIIMFIDKDCACICERNKKQLSGHPLQMETSNFSHSTKFVSGPTHAQQ